MVRSEDFSLRVNSSVCALSYRFSLLITVPLPLKTKYDKTSVKVIVPRQALTSALRLFYLVFLSFCFNITAKTVERVIR